VENNVEPVTFFAKDQLQLRAVFVYKEIGDTFVHIPVAETLVPGQLLTQRDFRMEGINRLPLHATERAISMVVREDSMAALCFVGPGSSVDVWVISDAGATLKLLSGATLLAIGDTASTTRPGQCQDQRYRQITVAVPEADVKDKIQALQSARGGVSIAIVGGSELPQEQMRHGDSH
jgi:Flp pilus assembly protein CpaB